ncbi:hypothetical protein OKE68_02610 [Riemerella anatipestifer]|uniref:Uncharacterized protein n=1 Tax=Riemerella anatipestifer TaxID=34085 RepID=A0AAP6HDX7_RIEAN|nr:hypothetical protein [Riemerella anatipestifer]MBT0572467.1 hypothetical protein [Riemerella anatipestifer]MCU7567572.1 hypothetical protein [Riemerella anatipestifer]MCU7570429.1 hypothetical protein [Riemerella anatipestifer]MCU7582042.1 hypothetical protein [Riemerella anatipestifer]MCW0485111.1 hypothetical protein [Riemerella anatipestifer]
MAKIEKTIQTVKSLNILEALISTKGDWYIIETNEQNGVHIKDREITLKNGFSLFFDAMLFYGTTLNYDYTKEQVFNEVKNYENVAVNLTYVEDNDFNSVEIDPIEKKAIENYIEKHLEINLI